MKRRAFTAAWLAALAVLATAPAQEVVAQTQAIAASDNLTQKPPRDAHGKRNAPRPAPAPGTSDGRVLKDPGEAGKSTNPDNMPVKRPDSKTNDAIIHQKLPSDAIAR